MQNNDDKGLSFLNYKRESTGQKSAQEVLLLCTTTRLSPRAKERLNKILSGPFNWEYFIKLAVFQGVLPLVTYNLSTSGLSSCIPQPYFNQFQHAYKYTAYRNVLLSNELVSVVTTLRNEGVETICLKGTALAEVIYGNACLRPAKDIDILVHPKDRVKASDIVARLGYKLRYGQDINHPFHEEYFKEAVFTLFLELHWGLENKQLVTFPEEKLWSRVRPLGQYGIAGWMLSPEDNLMFLSYHLHKHNTHQLKMLCDIAELLKKYEKTLDWVYIISSARSWQINSALYLTLKRAKTLLKAPVPPSFLMELRPNIWRRFLLELLVGQESYFSQNKETKLRKEMAGLAFSLMMNRWRGMIAVLTSYRGQEKSLKWLRIAFWITIVIALCLGRYLVMFPIKNDFVAAKYNHC